MVKQLNKEDVRVLSKLAEHNDFAKSLLHRYIKNLPLSDKQWHWMNRLVAKYGHREDSYFPNILGLFQHASHHLKYPSLKLPGIYLSWIPRYNSVRIRNYGYLEGSTGKLVTSFDKPEILSILQELEKDPIAYAAMKGIEYKHCMFCGRELSSPISLHHGYGPICAENFSLPWEGER